MKASQVIPILRIFDEAKALEFYVDWLGFKVDWTHRYDDNAPLYMQVSRDGIVLHLSEHHGDSTPGAKVFIECDGVREFHKELTEKKYKYNRPGLETEDWNAISVTVHDPFMNRLVFNQRLDS
jgi:uncharacterized glyoxalase superfamily protein PhnB